MSDQEKIEKIKIQNKEKYEGLTNDEIIMVLIDVLRKNHIEVLFENLAVLSFLQFPERFQLLGYSSFLDAKRVHDCIFHLGKHGKELLVGNRARGFNFSEKGESALSKIIGGKEGKGYKAPITKETRILSWIKLTPAYKKFMDNNSEEITEYEVKNLLRATNVSTPSYLRNSLDSYGAYAEKLNDSSVIKFVLFIKKKYSSLFVVKKLRGKK